MMNFFASIVLVAAANTTPSASAATPSGSATIPLEALIPLVTQQRDSPPVVAPPLDAVVVQSQLKGRLSVEALHVDAHFEVSVLADERWVKVPLLAVGPDVFVLSSSRSADAVVAVVDGQLCLLTEKGGTYAIDVSLLVRASTQGAQRRVVLKAAPGATLGPLRLSVDPAFALADSNVAGETVDVFPRSGLWTVAWQNAVPVVASKKQPTERPPLEPRITRATASWVSTLEGKVTLRVRYALQLDREQPLTVTVPKGHTLQRVVLNGRPVQASLEDGRLQLSVAPQDVGESSGVVELELRQELGVLHLSGVLELSIPSVSWPVAELNARAHLPSVFTYRRQGGSLEEIAQPEAAAGLEGPALPGKALFFRQYLVSASAPTLELRYSVDIGKSYFR